MECSLIKNALHVSGEILNRAPERDSLTLNIKKMKQTKSNRTNKKCTSCQKGSYLTKNEARGVIAFDTRKHHNLNETGPIYYRATKYICVFINFFYSSHYQMTLRKNCSHNLNGFYVIAINPRDKTQLVE